MVCISVYPYLCVVGEGEIRDDSKEKRLRKKQCTNRNKEDEEEKILREWKDVNIVPANFYAIFQAILKCIYLKLFGSKIGFSD